MAVLLAAKGNQSPSNGAIFPDRRDATVRQPRQPA